MPTAISIAALSVCTAAIPALVLLAYWAGTGDLLQFRYATRFVGVGHIVPSLPAIALSVVIGHGKSSLVPPTRQLTLFTMHGILLAVTAAMTAWLLVTDRLNFDISVAGLFLPASCIVSVVAASATGLGGMMFHPNLRQPNGG